MIAAFIILGSLLALLPTLMMVEGLLANGLVSAIAALGIVTVAFTLHTNDLNRFSRLPGPTAFIVLFIPCLWIVLQVLPIPIRSLANSIWITASTALDKPFVGAISLDIGATLLSLAQYCAALGAAVIATAVTLNRQRAESVLSLLTAIATLIAAELIAFNLGYLRFPGFERADALNIAVIGFILSCATTITAYERLDAPGTRHRNSGTKAKAAALASTAALFICLSAILINADAVMFLAALFGAGILVSVSAIRRWRLGLWGQAGTAVLAAVAMAGFFAVVPAKKGASPTLALSTQGGISSIERMLSDTKWGGSGAGSFEALWPIYRDSSEADSFETPTAAATIAIEMGHPFLWAYVIMCLMGAWTLVRRALLRGRDYIYSSAGASCIIALLISSFANDGILGLPASLMISILCGLAFAQSKSSSSNRDSDLSEKLSSIPIRTNDRAAEEFFSMKPSTSTKVSFRVGLALFGIFLAAQAAWILLPETNHTNRIQLTADGKFATIAPVEQDKIRRAASLAVVRGDLWAESAFTYGDPLPTNQAMDHVGDKSNTEALKPLTEALRYSPHRGDVWLVFAALADQYKWAGYQPSSLLKMSYYTAPNELALFPLRLNVSLRTKEAIDDAELQDMVRRDISVVLTRAPALRPALVTAYKSALPQGKAFAERVISEIDPGYLGVVRAAYP
jgi:hypothetical protein